MIFAFWEWASQVMLVVKNPQASAGDIRDAMNPWVGKIPWRRARQPTPVFLPGESHIQRSLVGYSSQGFKESDMTEKWPSMHFWRIPLIGIGTYFKSLLFDLNSYTVWAYVTELAIILLASMTKPSILSRWNRYLHSLFCLFAFSFFNLNLFLFKGRIIALRCCAGFCHTLTWISHRYSQVPSLLSLPPPVSPVLPSVTEHEIWAPCCMTQGAQI